MDTVELASNNAFFKKQNEDLYIDPETRLIKKDYMISYIEYLVKENKPFSAYLCNIDDFTVVNDFYGEDCSDQLLAEIARKIESVVGSKGLVAKCVADEYLIVLENITEYDNFWAIGRDITVQISKEQFKSVGDSYITATLGGARYPVDATTSGDLILCLNKALYRGKIKGKNCFIIYLKEKHENIEIKKRERLNTSIDVTAKVFDILTGPNLNAAIGDTMHFLLTHFQLDHIAVETSKNMYYSHYSMKANETFAYIDSLKLNKSLTGDGIFKYSTRRELTKAGFDDITDELEKQRIESMILIKMTYGEENYGLLRVDMQKPRIWQPEEVSLFLTIARVIAMLLHMNKTTIDELKKK